MSFYICKNFQDVIQNIFYLYHMVQKGLVSDQHISNFLGRGVLLDEFLWSHFFTSEKYDIRTFQNRAECPHTTSGYFFSIIIVENAQNNTNFWFFCVTRKYRYRGDTQDVV